MVRSFWLAFVLTLVLLAPGAWAQALPPEDELQLQVSEMQFDRAQLEAARRILEEGSGELSQRHQQVYQELARVLRPEQMERLRQMSRWGRYGPPESRADPMSDAAEQQLMLALMGEIARGLLPSGGSELPAGNPEVARRVRALLSGQLPVEGLWPTARQTGALTSLLEQLARQGSPQDRARVESELRRILTPEQIEFLRRLEALEREP